MNIITQKCNVCSAINTANDLNWIRVFGAHTGAPNLSQVTNAGNTNTTAALANATAIDICPTCQPATTLSQLVAMTTAATTAIKAAAVAAPVTAATAVVAPAPVTK